MQQRRPASSHAEQRDARAPHRRAARRRGPGGRRGRGRARRRESATASALATFCSTRRTAIPSSFRRAIVFITSWTIFGARPWLGSSNSTRPGRADERARDRDHLHLAAREVLALAVHQVLERAEDLEALALAPGAKPGLLARDREVARDRERREDAPVVGHPAEAAPGDLVRRRARDVGAVEADAAAPRRRQAERRSAAASSCRRRSARAARRPRRGRPRARRRTAPASRRSRCRRGRATSITRPPRPSAAPRGSRAARRACRRRSPAPSAAPRRRRRGRTGSACRAR